MNHLNTLNQTTPPPMPGLQPPEPWPKPGHQIPSMRNPPPPPPRNREIKEGEQPEPLEPDDDYPVIPPNEPKAYWEPGVLDRALHYLKGSAEHLGTTKNLLREVIVGSLTAVATLVIISLASLQQPSDIEALRDVVNLAVQKSHEADSLKFRLETFHLMMENDSLRQTNYWLQRNKLDSLTAEF
jgi:hypothetical protein